MRRPTAYLLRIFVTGLLAALPLAATVAVFWWVASFVIRWLGPDSGIGQVLAAVGLGVGSTELVGYAMGLAVVSGGIFGLGLLVTHGLQRGLSRLLQGLLRRIPVVGSVYAMANRLVGLFAQRQDGGLNSMSAVWCHFGGAPDALPAGGASPAPAAEGVVVLALLSTPEPVLIGGRPHLGLIVPTAPVPVGGGLLYVPESWVRPADIGIEAVTSLYVSMGITSAQYLPLARPKPASRP